MEERAVKMAGTGEADPVSVYKCVMPRKKKLAGGRGVPLRLPANLISVSVWMH